MATDEQLRNWTAQGAQTAAQNTYAAIEAALRTRSIQQSFDAQVFLQGSYANHTNIRGDSDVDIVVMMRTAYMPDVSRLTANEQLRYELDRVKPSDTVDDLREEVRLALNSHFGESRVHPKNKCIKVDKRDGYVDADVVPCQEHRLYRRYSGRGNSDYIEGISIKPLTGSPITNYPKEHKSNGQIKNGRCADYYKPTVRQIKQLRRKLVDAGVIGPQDAPGYVLECLTYNVPDSRFEANDSVRVRRVLSWLHDHTAESLASSIWSCDMVHHLFRDDPGQHNQYTAERVIGKLWSNL